MMRYLFCLLGLASAIAAPAAARVDVVTTTANLAAIAQAIGGEGVRARSLTSGRSDPHFAVAKPSMVRRIYGADLLLAVGAGLEVGWLPAALRAGRNPRLLPGRRGFLDLSRTARLLEVPVGPVDRSMGDVHAGGNPHYLLDPARGLEAARRIAGRLAAIDSGNADAYRQRLADFEARLSAERTAWAARLEPLRGRKVVAYHRTFSYLADAFGFEITAQIEPLPGIAPTASHLAGLVARIRSEGIGLVIMAPYFERRSAELLRRQTGIRVAVLPSAVGGAESATSYVLLFDAIADALDRAGAL